ncbi:unnamed protein product [Calicophoron daubneyi]|uniref:Uncharacterized protein n=1 Tax=Calicophoron daubneyi TaxID=300641 RepID=A0AAV2T8P9_CALDB
MPVTGVEQILCSNPLTFEAFMLHGRTVVVDGEDFLRCYGPNEPYFHVFGGEYLELAEFWRDILANIKQCEIDPLFVFSSSTERRGLQLLYQLQGMKWRIKNLVNLEKLKFTPEVCKILPPLSQSLLADLLCSMKITQLRTPYCIKRSCSSLAVMLNCPLMADAAEYFLLSAKAPMRAYPGFDFIPLQLSRITPFILNRRSSGTITPSTDRASEGQAYGLPVHRFLPEFSELSKVPEFYRTFIFLLLGSDAIPRINLPKPVYSRMDEIEGGDYKTRRWNTLVEWLSQFKGETLEPLDRILACYLPDDRVYCIYSLIDSLLTYIPTPTVASTLSQLLQRPASSPKKVYVCQGNGICAKQKSVQEANRYVQHPKDEWKSVVHQVLHGCSDEDVEQPDFSVGWPASLVRAFQLSELAGYLLVPLYCSGGVVLPMPVEQSNSTLSVFEASRPLRVLHYRLLAGLEHRLGKEYKLIGLKPNAIEYIRCGCSLVRHEISVAPLDLDTKTDTTSSILGDYLELTFPPGIPDADWLLSLAVCIAVYHRHQRQGSNDCSHRLTESPVALAVIITAVANALNVDIVNHDLCVHYQDIARLARSKVDCTSEYSGAFLTPAFRVDYVHAFNAIQIIYECLRSLVSVLDALLPQKPRTIGFRFPPAWVIFPSGQLVHWLAASLANQEPGARYHSAMRFWLPRLYRFQANNKGAPAELKRMAFLVDSLLTTAESLISEHVCIPEVSYTQHDLPANMDKFQPVRDNFSFFAIDLFRGAHETFSSTPAATIKSANHNRFTQFPATSGNNTKGDGVSVKASLTPESVPKNIHLKDAPTGFRQQLRSGFSQSIPKGLNSCGNRPYRGRVSTGYSQRLLNRLDAHNGEKA